MGAPYFVHRLVDVYGPAPGKDVPILNQSLHTPDGRAVWVRAVFEPYPAIFMERLFAAYLVLRGKAHAFYWPEPGELERIQPAEDSHD